MATHRSRSRGVGVALAAATLVLLALGSPAFAVEPYQAQFRISQIGADGDAARSSNDNPSAAFDVATNQALVVWTAEDTLDDKSEVFGRFMTSEGVLLGGEFRIGTAGGPGDAARDAFSPRVAYNSVRNEFLVVWHADSEATDDDFEIRAQRLSASGTLIAGEFRVSSMGPGDASFNGSEPQVAYNPARDEYVVVWHGVDDGLPGRTEVYAHRVTGAGELTGDDVRVSSLRNDSTWPTIAYNSAANEYMVAFIGKDSPSTPSSQRTFVQRLTADGAPVGPNRQIFQTGEVHKPAIAYNPTHNQFLVATPGIVAGDTEAYVQRLDATGTEIGTDDERISHMGPDGAPAYGLGVDISVGFTPRENQYVVTWHGDTTSFGLVQDENEVFAQELDASGNEIGTEDNPISSMGPDGSSQYGVGDFQFTGPLAWAADTDRFFVVWNGDDGPPLADNEVEVYGRMAQATPLPPPPPPPPPPPLPPPPPPPPPAVIPNFAVQFATRARGSKGVHGSLYGIAGFAALPNGSTITLRCDKGCTLKATSFTLRLKATKGKKKKTSMTLRKPVRIGKNSRVRVTVRHAGYISRYVRYRFVRKKIGLDVARVGHGCQTTTKPPRNIRCP
jgi:hypothetical protein